MPHIELKGIHKVKKTLASGSVRQYHYVYRGGPQFWSSDSSFKIGSVDYFEAYFEHSKLQGMRSRPQLGKGRSTSDVVHRFRESIHYTNLAIRTRSDYDRYLDLFDTAFGEDPIKMFEEAEAVAEIRKWKEQWRRSPKQYDYATSVVTRLLNWARDEDKAIAVHHHVKIARVYKPNRAEITWLPHEISSLINVASEREARVVIAASEGGLTPQDIGILKREHVQNTPNGRRLYFKRTKTGKPVSIPVTPALGQLIDTTPKGQEYLVVSLEGRQLRPERASGIIRRLKERANAFSEDKNGYTAVRDELRLYDMRGTAATELLRAGCSLNEIAVTMGWGIRHAGNIIEQYAATVPEVADEVLAKLTAARQKKAPKA